jgi:protein TonB
MFSALESTWDHSARRGWTTLASFTLQAFGLSLLLAISVIWVERPPQVHWLQITTPAAFPPSATTEAVRAHHATATASNPRQEQITEPQSIPLHVAAINDAGSVPSAPDWTTIGTGLDRGSRDGVLHSLGGNFPVVIPQRPVAVKPLLVSHWAEGNLIYRVRPVYPSLARQARVQGTVELRAIISKAGTIENLVVVRGHPMLSAAALEAVRQWRYRPYLLNNEPIEVETEITVNFVLSGS